MNIILGGYFIGEDLQRHQITVTTNPVDSIVEKELLAYKSANGIIKLSVQPEPDMGSFELALYVENGNYLLMLSDYDEDGDIDVRTISEDGVEKGFTSILGEPYPAKAVTHNFQLISSIFKEFALKGDVSKDVMN